MSTSALRSPRKTATSPGRASPKTAAASTFGSPRKIETSSLLEEKQVASVDGKTKRMWVAAAIVAGVLLLGAVVYLIYHFVFQAKKFPSSGVTPPSSKPQHHRYPHHPSSRPPHSGVPPHSSAPPRSSVPPHSGIPPSSYAPSHSSTVPPSAGSFTVNIASYGSKTMCTTGTCGSNTASVSVQGTPILSVASGGRHGQPKVTILGSASAPMTPTGATGTAEGYLGVVLSFQQPNTQVFSHHALVAPSFVQSAANDAMGKTLASNLANTIAPYLNGNSLQPVNGYLPVSLSFCVFGDASGLWNDSFFQDILANFSPPTSFKTMTAGFPGGAVLDMKLGSSTLNWQGAVSGTPPAHGVATYQVVVK